jgi:hypothetical protein
MVGITIQKCVNQKDNPIGIIFRRKDQVSVRRDMVCLREYQNRILHLTRWTRTFGQDARGVWQSRNQEHGQTALRHGKPQDKDN